MFRPKDESKKPDEEIKRVMYSEILLRQKIRLTPNLGVKKKGSYNYDNTIMDHII